LGQIWALRSATFAIVLRENRALIEAIDLTINQQERAELGYWIGKSYTLRALFT
jgi:RimJ/RimL family protein N-acetyltransferase